MLLRKIVKGTTECSDCTNYTALNADETVVSVDNFGSGNIRIDKHVRNSNNVSLSAGWNMVSITTENNDSSSDINVSLSAGWNLIGYSSDVNVSLDNLTFTNSSGTRDTFTNSARAGKVQKNVAYIKGENTNSKKYSFVGKSNADAGLTKNRGYWIYAQQAGNVTLPGVRGSAKNESYKLSDLMFSNGTDELNVTDAYSAGWIPNRIYYWNPSVSAYSSYNILLSGSTMLLPWDGYFVQTLKSNITMLRQN
jgi:hypothetical protein